MMQPDLTLEQQFEIQKFQSELQHLNTEELRYLLIKLHKHMVVREATYKQLLKHNWEIGEKS